jgi:hypothetical protein
MNDDQIVQICRQMNDLRCELDDEVEQVVDSARALASWRYYVARHPWACLACAAAAGFVMVPRRTRIAYPDGKVLAEVVDHCQRADVSHSPFRRRSIGRAVFGLLARAAVRGALAYAGSNASRFMARTAAVYGGSDAEPIR